MSTSATTYTGPPLRVAIVGCGQIADAHLVAARVSGLGAVAAVCDTNADLARQAALRFDVPRWDCDVDEMLCQVQPHVVHICTPPATHRTLMERAVDAGAHVYVEKPFAVSVAEARSMLAFAAARRRLVCAGHDRLFDPAWLECRQRIADGAIGELIHIEVFQAYDLEGPFGRIVAEDDRHWVRRLRGGLFQNVIPHGLAAIADLIQDERPLVSATSWHRERNQFTRLLVLVRGSQTSATLTFLSSLRPATTYVRVYGRRGWLEVDYDARVARLRVDSTLPSLFTKLHEPWRDMLGGLRGLTRNLIGLLRSDLDYFSGMRRLIRTFYTSVLAGGCSPTDASDIERVAMLLDDILDALDDSRVLVSPVPASSI